ncbi:GGDEF domain-containing protein [Methylobacterium iners]|uniref:diguanylate cyclase n=1 Tax=Methylobacterium iners TaxID=418707 RepID=A0ABQ4S443_9HYPH|nr:GGDEF domain-containing protein [Methylobacterium iners]GJD97898.1 hypothetical protein OCOJLMKI_5137 [Methylobacterium iners]
MVWNDSDQTETTRLLQQAEKVISSGRYLRKFEPELEGRYEADTQADRVRRIRRTIVLGLAVFHAYNLAALVTTPDLVFLNLVLRIGVMTPVGLLIAWSVGRVTPGLREAFCGLGMVSATGIPLVLFWLSNAPSYVLMASGVGLTVIFSNTTLPLRFPWACTVSATAAAGMAVAVAARPDLGAGAASVLVLDLATAILFSLLATYRIEVGARRDYLLTLRESLRSDRLAADNTALARLSLTDPLTGLANRRAFTARLSAFWQASTRGKPFAVILLDVDHFKRFNDRYGHGAGDACLREISAILAPLVPGRDDLVARYGGEEFAVLAADCSYAEAVGLAERLRLAVSGRGLPHAGRADGISQVTISVGVAVSAGHTTSAAALVEAADIALYEAKARGRDQTYPMPAYFFESGGEAPAETPPPTPLCA